MYTNATLNQIHAAVSRVNEKYGYRLVIKNMERKSSNRVMFTIRSERSGIPGSCNSWSGRKSVSASWHAHGYLFEELLSLGDHIYILSQGRRIDKDGGNWQSMNVGSLMNPVFASSLSNL